MSTCHFSVEGGFITEHCRNLWAEGAYVKAMDVLDCMIGMQHEQKLEILFGTKQLTGVNELDLVDDDWKPAKGIDYPSYKEGMRRGENWEELKALQEDKAWQIAYDEWPYSRKGFAAHTFEATTFSKVEKLVGKERAEAIFAEVQDNMMDRQANSFKTSKSVDLEVEPERPDVDPLTLLYAQAQQNILMGALEQGLDIDSVPTIDAMMNRGSKIEVVLDEKMTSASGWLLPNGNFYGCGAMEHIGLAESLLEHIGSSMTNTSNAELIGESFGWIKISRSMMGFYVGCKKKPTKKQLNKLWDYSVLHKKDYEDMMRQLEASRHHMA